MSTDASETNNMVVQVDGQPRVLNKADFFNRGVNAPPLDNVGKTGLYIRRGRTYFRFPAEVVTSDGEVIRGAPLAHVACPALRRASRSKYDPHVGAKQLRKQAAKNN